MHACAWFWAFMFVGGWACVSLSICGVQGTTFWRKPSPSALLKQGLSCSFCFYTTYSKQAAQQTSDSSVSASNLTVEVLGLQVCATASGFLDFLHRFQGSNWGYQACMDSTLSMKPSPLLFVYFNKFTKQYYFLNILNILN